MGGYHTDYFHFAPPETIGPVADALLKRGYRKDDLLGILGGNWLRVCGEVWK